MKYSPTQDQDSSPRQEASDPQAATIQPAGLLMMPALSLDGSAATDSTDLADPVLA